MNINQANGSLKAPQINAFTESTSPPRKASAPAGKGFLGGLLSIATRLRFCCRCQSIYQILYRKIALEAGKVPSKSCGYIK
ncbi:uncharacterized protein PV09_04285 [Verruconis gallopava]|uniref:Uncharacterized protein n=1 Tax=Verruconis gallopava TaxID=253628 RepID=A0A0D1XPR8_9PEZI|nr:uncharacterized protein PV09_04285 [Verruconis gallopava]KIW04531.1 hypothetical protein PV09_04285 [Verruconis gallopava]